MFRVIENVTWNSITKIERVMSNHCRVEYISGHNRGKDGYLNPHKGEVTFHDHNLQDFVEKIDALRSKSRSKTNGELSIVVSQIMRRSVVSLGKAENIAQYIVLKI